MANSDVQEPAGGGRAKDEIAGQRPALQPPPRDQRSPLPRRRRGKDRRPRKKETPFRLTPARREAGIRNLRRANLARKLEWHPHRVAPEHWAKALRNLRLADAARAVRGNYFRHGLYAALLPAAIRRAGESPEEFAAHVARFERALGGGAEAGSKDEAGLIRAAAELVWRHIRAFRCQGEWELAQLARLLGRLDGYPIPRVGQASDVAVKVVDILCGGYGGLAVPLGRLRRRLENVFRDIFVARFGWDPQFRIFRLTRRPRPNLEGMPAEWVACPVLPAWRVERVRANEEKFAQITQGGVCALAESRFARSRRKDLRELQRVLHRIFLGAEPAPGSAHERATARLETAVLLRLQCFPRQAEWQGERVREILERAARRPAWSPRGLWVVLLRILKVFEASNRTFDHLPRYGEDVQEALRESLRAAYRRNPFSFPY